MKNKNSELSKKIIKQILIFIIVCFFIVGAGYIFLHQYILNSDFQWLYDYSPNLYYKAIKYFDMFFGSGGSIAFILLVCCISFSVLLIYFLRKSLSYISAFSESANKLFDKDADYISLPPEMSELEKKLNHFKQESISADRRARENEQKKDELIVYLAHDIKTPLTSMIGYLSILDEIDDMPAEQRKKYIHIALEKSYRLEDLINELFDTARFNSEKIILEKEDLNLNLLLAQLVDDFYPVLQEMDKTINVNCDSGITLYGDPDKLGRVFGNLIKNAINYSRDNSDININVSKSNTHIAVDVINSGKEIPKEKLDKIFENFYRLDASRNTKTGGSGLGLAIAKEIVELHGGTISAESNREHTIFHVELPNE